MREQETDRQTVRKKTRNSSPTVTQLNKRRKRLGRRSRCLRTPSGSVNVPRATRGRRLSRWLRIRRRQELFRTKHRIQKSRSLDCGRLTTLVALAVVAVVWMRLSSSNALLPAVRSIPQRRRGFSGARRFLHDLLLSDVCNAESMAETIEDFTVPVAVN